ncbi:hypothetical protein EIN_025920 [Entamoeba invadens IP1]|uniref:hypothetical protein n=1 Tax=Entamoeba invadens IP1 TaxID=370355 RepID=UPI0002C3F3E6|nr:hypothetical protein EIN_025920 [Entamoeba invadens IP1]ELP90753.1 hypothetical protein EIN_025920 [Entamoeba invadens IP1]|eukprot:XP_004257524.1 hypothetical protein EIN_025920 [Entamoeba invadens IP1]
MSIPSFTVKPIETIPKMSNENTHFIAEMMEWVDGKMDADVKQKTPINKAPSSDPIMELLKLKILLHAKDCMKAETDRARMFEMQLAQLKAEKAELLKKNLVLAEENQKMKDEFKAEQKRVQNLVVENYSNLIKQLNDPQCHCECIEQQNTNCTEVDTK